MPVFRYDTPENRRIGSIADLIQRQGQIQANAAQQVGQAQAQAAAQRGQIWGNTIGSIGQMIGAVPQQLQQQKEQAQVGQMRAMQLEAGKQEQAQRQAQMADVAAMDQAYSPQAALGPGGQGPMPQGAPLPDRETILKALPGHLQPIAQKQFAEIDEAKAKNRATRDDFFASLAAGVHKFGNDPGAALFALKEAAEDYPEKAAELGKLIQQNPDPAFIGKLTSSLMAKSAKYAGLLQKEEAPKTREVTVTNPDGSTTIQIVKDEPGQTFTSAAKPAADTAPGTFGDYLKRVATDQGKPIGQLSAGEVRKAKEQFDAAGRAPKEAKDERLVQIMGPQGAPIWVRESEAVNKPAAQAARAVTGQERQTLAFYNRAQEAAKTVEPLEENIGKMSLAGQARLQAAPNWLQSKENQSYRQAQRAFTEARLRKESGAAIPPAEYENDSKTYFAQPGDTPELLAQKRAARQTVLEGLAFSAGKAYDEYYGEPRPKGGAKPTETGGKGGDVIYAKDPSGKVHQAPAGTALPAGWLQVEKR
jgi:hypothetical protein